MYHQVTYDSDYPVSKYMFLSGSQASNIYRPLPHEHVRYMIGRHTVSILLVSIRWEHGSQSDFKNV